jgi:serine/threonine protein kinase
MDLQKSSAPQSPSGLLPEGTVVGGRYTILRTIGAGGNGVTYLASDKDHDGRQVAVKSLLLRGLQAWKQLDLFEREGKVLRGMDHPNIPRYIDSFEVRGGRNGSNNNCSSHNNHSDMLHALYSKQQRRFSSLLATDLSFLPSTSPPPPLPPPPPQVDSASDRRFSHLFEAVTASHCQTCFFFPAYPRQVDSASDRGYYLVQELADGRSLSDLIRSGAWRPTEDEVVDVALQLLNVLEYLGSLRPPVIHRDIK